MEITKFNEKFNRVEGNIYAVEEIIILVDGVYEAPLMHDNANNINVYTGPKLTGDKINTYSLSTPSLTTWKTVIKIFSNITPLYISYETTGDTVESEDINNLQDAVNLTQEELNKEIDRATKKEDTIESNLNAEIIRAKESENVITDNLENEVNRATNAESTLTSNLNKEIDRAKQKENEIVNDLSAEIARAKESENVITGNLENEVNRAVSAESIITSNLDKEINRSKEKESEIESDINANRANWNDAYNKRHTHSNKAIIDALGKNVDGDLTFEGGKIVSTTINGLTDDINIQGGNNISISKDGNNIIIAAAGGQEKIVTNTPISVSTSNWVLDTSESPNFYKTTIQHNLDDTNIIVSVYNGSQMAELTGIKIIDSNTIELRNYEAMNCKVIINSSGQPTEVIDNLNSSESTKALSAKQGKVLKEIIDNVEGGIKVGKILSDAVPVNLFFKILD